MTVETATAAGPQTKRPGSAIRRSPGGRRASAARIGAQNSPIGDAGCR
jgi:hypothetical protein